MATALLLEESLEEAPAVDRRTDGRFEWIDGQEVEKPPVGVEETLTTFELLYRLRSFVGSVDKGVILGSDCTYRIFPHKPGRTRIPDGSLILGGRLPLDPIPTGYTEIVPDLVLEVVSPNDKADEIDERVDDYLRAGVPLVWVLHTSSRTLYAWRPDGTGRRITIEGTIGGGDVLPGFSLAMAELFRGLGTGRRATRDDQGDPSDRA